jgi:hypothetical protein
MSQTITMTELLRNPKKIRALVKKGIKLYVLYEGEVVMVINLPSDTNSSDLNSKNLNFPTTNAGGIADSGLTKDDIYGQNSWLDKK